MHTAFYNMRGCLSVTVKSGMQHLVCIAFLFACNASLLSQYLNCAVRKRTSVCVTFAVVNSPRAPTASMVTNYPLHLCSSYCKVAKHPRRVHLRSILWLMNYCQALCNGWAALDHSVVAHFTWCVMPNAVLHFCHAILHLLT